MELAYAAGILDGEGSIVVTKQKRKENKLGYAYFAYVNITNTYRPVLEEFQRLFGGTIILHEGPSRPRTHRVLTAKQDCYRIQWRGPKAAAVITALRPWLMIKAKQADNLLAFCAVKAESGNYSKNTTTQQEQFMLESKRLNKFGGDAGELTVANGGPCFYPSIPV